MAIVKKETAKKVETTNTAAQAAPITPEVAEAVAAVNLSKKELRNAARKTAKAILASWVASPKLAELALPEDFAAALNTMYGKAVRVKGEKTGKTLSLTDKLYAAFCGFANGDGMDELELFKQFKIGRGEMRKKVRSLIRDCASADRIYIAFDEAKESWIVQGRGATPPAGWKGYMPSLDAKAE